MTRWDQVGGKPDGESYAARFAELAKSGANVHGEADFCSALVPVGSTILDAGCGTGRVAIELQRRGNRCVGVDVDESMLAVARAAEPSVHWITSDLATFDIADTFDLIVAAGNVIPLLAEGTEPSVISLLATRLAPGGLLVAGFGLDAAHLPLPAPPFGLDEYDAWCSEARLELSARFATWDCQPFEPEQPAYAVSVHLRPSVH